MIRGMKHLLHLSIFACFVTVPLVVAEEQPAGQAKRSVPESDAALDEKVRKIVFDRQPAVLDLPIGWHEIQGLSGHSQWHILGTRWWVDLHPALRGLEKLDKNKQYVVHGVPLEQRYGVIDVWAYKVTEK